jgi:hypothetical protein
MAPLSTIRWWPRWQHRDFPSFRPRFLRARNATDLLRPGSPYPNAPKPANSLDCLEDQFSETHIQDLANLISVPSDTHDVRGLLHSWSHTFVALDIYSAGSLQTYPPDTRWCQEGGVCLYHTQF